ncbi:MAG: LemA family protein [Muribaculaceae bacterium]|nr:LemA family protein [Muribaculaceae bacterium]
MKKTGIIIVAVIVVLVVAVGIWASKSYNSFVTLDQDVQQSWSQVEVQYQRRMDLIPNLVSTVQGYAAHESSTFENVTRARAGLSEAYNAAAADSAATPADAAAFQRLNNAQGELNRALSIYVNAVREAYPDLKANTQFLDLQTQLEGTENRIATARTRYNEVVRDYNVRIRRFPANIMAGMFGFDVKPQYEADAAAATAPRVQF